MNFHAVPREEQAAVLAIYRGPQGPEPPICQELHNTCGWLSSNLPGSEAGLCLYQDLQSFKVNRIFPMI